MDIKGVIHGFIDKIFKPPITFLNMAIEKLQEVQLVSSQGLNIGKYFAVFGDLPSAWQLVVSSILLSTVLLGTLLIFRSIMRMYYSVKEGVKWW
ncbi:hypothetical protein [Peribacillus sp. TH24]|uniref:hypothetical protein n=1 Tax=Peribacillus sp. TH24 TaxID=2798483 RepID=UPI00191144C0|nr:hypothetical protein [Peribacillus sp. TH24]MBK5447026.1 hypothetical protein [Peribacillus sp. TH24]MBK5447057.1 hypothetical protein [Peribacillus sp. TH24]